MASRRLSVILDLDTGNYSGRMSQAGQATRTLGGNVSKTNDQLRRLTGSFDTLNSKMTSPLQKLRDYTLILANLRYAIINVRDIAVGWVGALITQSAEVERLTTLMKGLSDATTEVGKTKEAAANLKAIFAMSRQTGFAVQALADGFVKMKSAGLDPLDGSLKSLTDAVAAFGGTTDIMHRATIAIQQMAGKGVVSMEELRQQLGEAVPSAIQSMARAMGKSVPELAKEIKKGTVAAGPALKLMFDEFERLYAGSGARMVESFNGQIALVKTNMMELSTDFTGLNNADGNGGLFASTKGGLKELNEALRSNEAKQFMRDLGTIVGDVAGFLMNATRMAVEFRNEIGVVFKAAMVGIIAVKGTQIASWLIGVGSAGVRAFSGIGLAAQAARGPMSGIVTAMNSQVEAYDRLGRISALRVDRLRSEVTNTQAQVQALRAQGTELRGRANDYAQNTQILDRHKAAAAAALAQGRATGRYRDFETKQFISQARAIEINNNAIKASARNRFAAITTARQLATVEAQLNRAAVTGAAAQAGLATATTAAARAASFAAAASRTAAAAVSLLGRAVNIALGPIGIIALVLVEAANAAGVFENKAKAAAQAAYDLARGIGTAAQAQKLADRIAANNKFIEGEEAYLNSWGGRYKAAQGDTADIARRKAEIAARKKENERNERALRIDGGYRGGEQIVSDIRSTIDQRKVRASTDYRAGISALDARKGSMSRSAYDAEVRKLQAIRDNASDVKLTGAAVRSLEKDLDGVIKKYGKNSEQAQAVARALMTLRESAGASVVPTNQAGDAVEAAGESGKKGAKGLSEAEKAFEKYQNQIVNGMMEIEELQAKLDGSGDGGVAAFEKGLAGGKFKGATDAQIKVLREQAATIDELKKKIDVKDIFADLNGELTKATTRADELWKSFTSGTLEADERVAQIKARFSEVVEKLSGGDAQKAAAIVDQIVNAFNRADMAQIADQWRLETEEITNSLLTENEQREASFQAEVLRRQKLLDMARLEGQARVDAQRAFENWKKASEDRIARESEFGVRRMMRDWANLSVNIGESLANSMSMFVDGMAEGKLKFGDLAKSIVKDLIKIILKAMIAYAIMSALGMTTGGAQGAMSFGQFLTSQISSGLSGTSAMGGGQSNVGFGKGPQGDGSMSAAGVNHKGGAIGGSNDIRMVASSLFDSAHVYHGGGKVGKRPLMPGEKPIIAEEGEIILNEAQQKNLNGKMGGTPVTVNFINNSGVALEAEQSDPEWNGKEMIVNIVVEAMQKQGKMRDTISQVARG